MIARLARIPPLFGISVILGLFLFGSPSLFAQDEPSEIRSSADYVYGQSMRFNLMARNAGDISSVTLYFRLGLSPDSYSVDVPFSSGPESQATYSLDLNQTRLPPFGPITYWWELETSDGARTRVSEQVVNYVDDQFNWRQLSETDSAGGGTIRFFWTGDDQTLGEQAKNITIDLLKGLGRLIPIDQVLPFDVYIYPSSADLSAAMRLSGREFVPGRQYPDLGVLLITVVNPQTADAELRREISTGLVDLLLYQATGKLATAVPPWLVAGLAGSASGQPDLVGENLLRLAVANDSALPFETLCALPSIDDDLARAQSTAVINYIVRAYGDQGVRDLISAFTDGAVCSGAIQQTLGVTPEQFDTAWQRSIRQSGEQTNRVFIILWIVLIAAGFGLAGLLIIRPRRQRLKPSGK